MNGDFFTVDSFATLYGSCFASVLLTNTFCYISKLNHKWIGLVFALLVSFMAANLSSELDKNYFIIILNGIMIYANNVGIVQITGKKKENFQTENGPYGSAMRASNIKNKRIFWTKWY